MTEDKLTQEQRIRLEALAQAINARTGNDTANSLVQRAEVFEAYISGREGSPEGSSPLRFPSRVKGQDKGPVK